MQWNLAKSSNQKISPCVTSADENLSSFRFKMSALMFNYSSIAVYDENILHDTSQAASEEDKKLAWLSTADSFCSDGVLEAAVSAEDSLKTGFTISLSRNLNVSVSARSQKEISTLSLHFWNNE